MFSVSQQESFLVQYQSDEASEEFKIASFVAMVDACSVIGVPYSSTTGLVSWLFKVNFLVI